MYVEKISFEERFCSWMWGSNCVMGILQNWEVYNELMVPIIIKIVK